MKAYTKSRAGKCPAGPAVNPKKVRPVVIPCGLDHRYTAHEVAEPYFSATPPGQYRDEASAWVPR